MPEKFDLTFPCYGAIKRPDLKQLRIEPRHASEVVWITVTSNSEECVAIWTDKDKACRALDRFGERSAALVALPGPEAFVAQLKAMPFSQVAVNPDPDSGKATFFEMGALLSQLDSASH